MLTTRCKKCLSTISRATLISLVIALAACAAPGSSSLTDSDGPASIPVTIAKLTPVIDQDSFSFELTVAQNILSSGTDLSADSVIGYVSATIEYSLIATVAVMDGDTVVETLTITDGMIVYPLTYQYLDTQLSFVVISTDELTDNETQSAPLYVTLFQNASSGDLILEVAIPDAESSSGTSVVKTVNVTEETLSPTIDSSLTSESGASESVTPSTSDSTATPPEETVPETTDPVLDPPPAEEGAANNAPTVGDVTATVAQDLLGRVYPNPVGVITIALDGTDSDGDALYYSIIDPPSAGTAVVVDNQLTYLPNELFTGNDQLTYVANDGIDDSNLGTITITVDKISTAALSSSTFNAEGIALTALPGSFASYRGVQASTVAYDVNSKKYVMFFETQIAMADNTCVGGYWAIGRAVSSDGGVTWTQDMNATIQPVSGVDFECGAAQPSVVFDGTTYHLFFSARGVNGTIDGIDYATSTDGGETFTTPVRIFNGQQGFTSALLVNDVLSVYYYYQSGQSYYINRIWSADRGATWNPANVNTNVISTLDAWSTGTYFQGTNKIITHSVFYDSSDTAKPYKMYVIGINPTGSQASNTNQPYYVGGLLESVDGLTWGLSSDLPVVANPVWYRHHEILLYGHNYLMWYKTLDASGKSVIKSSTTFSSWPQ